MDAAEAKMQEASTMLAKQSHCVWRAPALFVCAFYLSGCNQAVPTADAPPPPGKSITSNSTETAEDALSKQAAEFAAKVDRSLRDQAAGKSEIQWIQPMGPLEELRSSRTAAAKASVENEQAQKAPEPAPVVKSDSTRSADPAQLSNEQLLAALRDRLSKDHKSALKPYLAAAALSLLDPKAELTDADLTALSPEDRHLVLAYQRAFTHLGQSLRGSSDEDRRNLRSAAEELAEQTAERGKLRVHNAQLCTRVDGFGQYTPFAHNTFLAGKEQPAIVYAELAGYSALRDSGDQHYVVKLTQKIVLYNESDGLPVWKVEPTEILDRSRNARRDFFVVQLINLPARLSVGKYRLKLTITDEQGKAVDEASMPVNIVADTKLVEATTQ